MTEAKKNETDDKALRAQKCDRCWHVINDDYSRRAGCRFGLPFPLRAPSDCPEFRPAMAMELPGLIGGEPRRFPVELAGKYAQWFEQGRALMEAANAPRGADGSAAA